MKNSDPSARFHAWRIGMAQLLWLAASCVHAASPPADIDPDPWAEAPTVRQLLQMDAAAALANRRALLVPSRQERPAGAEPLSGTGAPSADRVRVAAIYGVGAGLRAEVLVNDALRIYRSGRQAAEGRQSTADGYDLIAITGACVSLRKRGQPLVACLDPSPSSALE